MSKVRVLVADDHTMLREALAALINAEPDMIFVAEAATCAESIQKAREVLPDVVVMDISMSDGSGIEALGKIRVMSPASRLLVLTMHDEPTHLRAALGAGAAGFVAKHAAGRHLLAGIREVHQGRSYVSVSLDASALQDLLAEKRAPLTERERQVLTLVAEGFTNVEVGERLGVSKKSVDTYRSRLCTKLRLRSRADLVRYALEVGLLRPGGSRRRT